MPVESRHGRRRRLTETHARTRQLEFYRHCLDGDLNGLKEVMSFTHWWAKRGTCACGCRKRRRNKPRISKGLCTMGLRHWVYKHRADVYALNQLLRSGYDSCDDKVALLFLGPTYRKRPW